MPDSSPPSSPNSPWENGWNPDTSRAPGTRRLYLAGVLAVTTIVVCVTAIVVTDKQTDDTSRTKKADSTTPAGADGPGLLSYASPSKQRTPTPDEHKSNSGSAKTPGSTTSTATSGHSSKPAAKSPSPSKSTSSHGSSSGSHGSSGSSGSSSSTAWKSVRSVNYPDRYWQVSGDFVKLNPATSTAARRAATFKVVKGLANSSCYSFTTAGGTYLRHRNFILRAERNDGSPSSNRTPPSAPARRPTPAR